MRSSAPAVLAAAKIKERGREAISLIFCPMFWPRCQLTMIGFPENSRDLGGNVTRGSKYIIISPRPSHNSLTPGGDPEHILKGVWKSVRWQFISSIKYLCILLMVSDEFLWSRNRMNIRFGFKTMVRVHLSKVVFEDSAINVVETAI